MWSFADTADGARVPLGGWSLPGCVCRVRDVCGTLSAGESAPIAVPLKEASAQ